MRLKTGITIVIATVIVFAVAVGLYQARPPSVERPEEYIVKVSVIDKHTKQPVYAIIEIKPMQEQGTSALAIHFAHLSAALEEGLYRLEVEATNYRYYSDVIRVDRDINVTVELEPE